MAKKGSVRVNIVRMDHAEDLEDFILCFLPASSRRGCGLSLPSAGHDLRVSHAWASPWPAFLNNEIRVALLGWVARQIKQNYKKDNGSQKTRSDVIRRQPQPSFRKQESRDDLATIFYPR